MSEQALQRRVRSITNTAKMMSFVEVCAIIGANGMPSPHTLLNRVDRIILHALPLQSAQLAIIPVR